MDVLAHAMPLHGFIGGLLIGVASAVMLLGLGRIAGISGLAARAARLSTAGAPWPVAAAFVIGLPLGALLVTALLGPVELRYPPSFALIGIAGLLVGFGTRLGSGCTSGHGVCGVSRLSLRSVAATLTFMAAGIVSVAIMKMLGIGG